MTADTDTTDLTAAQIDRALGAFIGAAVGDALGAPFEFGPAGQYTARFPEPAAGGDTEMAGGGGLGWRPGEFTDDTQMAVAMAESLALHRRVEPGDLWRRWRAWAADASDVGIITRAALAGHDWRTAASDAHVALGRSAGNGALMRVTPAGLLHARTSPGLATSLTLRIALEQGSLTHLDPAASWGAAICAELVRRAILGADPVGELAEVLSLLPDHVRVRFEPVLSPRWHPTMIGTPLNGTVWGCLAQAVWAVRAHHTFHDAVVAAIDLGGDTDTVACVTGALAGSRDGLTAIPSRWTSAVHGRLSTPDGVAEYDHTALRSLALRVLGVDEPSSGR
jgi:ADP-ribosyl-[dinitrogen reductase] hydrolase